MSRQLDRRLRKLEAAADRPPSSGDGNPRQTTLIVVTGGLPGEPRYATIGGRVIAREPEESLDDYCERCRSLAVEVGEQICIVGGLPSWSSQIVMYPESGGSGEYDPAADDPL